MAKSPYTGFSLLEILIALFLAALAVGLVVGDFGPSSRNRLEALADDLERAMRFSSDESAFTNSIIRVSFLLDQSPQEYAVEKGPQGSFVIPRLPETTNLSLEEQEKLKEKTKKLAENFNKIDEFQEENKQLEDGLKIVGIGSTLYGEFLTDFNVAIYHYPTGERDSAIIILASENEILGLIISAFSQEFEWIFRTLDQEGDISEAQEKIALELYEEWRKNRI